MAYMSVPTIVLVHGNFLGPWSWSDVTAKLHDTGFRTVTPDLHSADPRRQPRGDLHADAAAVREALDLLQPPVLLCGHSYGGAIITEAAAGDRAEARLCPERTVPRLRARAGSGGDRPAAAEQSRHGDPARHGCSVA